jgi:hypothetical protein
VRVHPALYLFRTGLCEECWEARQPVRGFKPEKIDKVEKSAQADKVDHANVGKKQDMKPCDADNDGKKRNIKVVDKLTEHAGCFEKHRDHE